MSTVPCPRCRGPTIRRTDLPTGLVVYLDPHPVPPLEASVHPAGVWRIHPKRGAEHVVVSGLAEEHPLHRLHQCTDVALF